MITSPTHQHTTAPTPLSRRIHWLRVTAKSQFNNHCHCCETL